MMHNPLNLKCSISRGLMILVVGFFQNYQIIKCPNLFRGMDCYFNQYTRFLMCSLVACVKSFNQNCLKYFEKDSKAFRKSKQLISMVFEIRV